MQLHTTSTWVNPHESDFDLRRRHDREDREAHHRHYKLHNYNGGQARRLFDDLAAVLRSMAVAAEDEFYTARHYPHIKREDALEHKWHANLQSRFKAHPAVFAAMVDWQPHSVHNLVFEWPHVSETDPNRLAYTRDNRSGHADRQTVTTVGKYLARHFPGMQDHAIRDLAARFAGYHFELWDTTDDIIRSVQDGPASCMQWENDCDHPYEVYAPALGWRAAVRLDGQKNIVGRCLVYESDRISKRYVRSYAHKEGGYSHSDEGLEAWLREQGYDKHYNWDGCRLARIESWEGSTFLAPYLDGDTKRVADAGTYLVVDPNGRLLFDCTDGGHGNCGGRECDNCGADHDEEDTTWVGRHGDYGVCPDCMDNFTYVLGRRGTSYYIHQDDAVHDAHDGQAYDPEYLADNNMVELHDGDITCQDNAVYLETRGEWWDVDDCDVVFCEHDDTHEHIEDVVQLADDTWADPDNTWECHVSGDRYHNDAHKRERVQLSTLNNQEEIYVHEDNIEEYYANLDAITGSTHPILAVTTTV